MQEPSGERAVSIIFKDFDADMNSIHQSSANTQPIQFSGGAFHYLESPLFEGSGLGVFIKEDQIWIFNPPKPDAYHGLLETDSASSLFEPFHGDAWLEEVEYYVAQQLLLKNPNSLNWHHLSFRENQHGAADIFALWKRQYQSPDPGLIMMDGKARASVSQVTTGVLCDITNFLSINLSNKEWGPEPINISAPEINKFHFGMFVSGRGICCGMQLHHAFINISSLRTLENMATPSQYRRINSDLYRVDFDRTGHEYFVTEKEKNALINVGKESLDRFTLAYKEIVPFNTASENYVRSAVWVTQARASISTSNESIGTSQTKNAIPPRPNEIGFWKFIRDSAFQKNLLINTGTAYLGAMPIIDGLPPPFKAGAIAAITIASTTAAGYAAYRDNYEADTDSSEQSESPLRPV